jgi:hypothetical protein
MNLIAIIDQSLFTVSAVQTGFRLGGGGVFPNLGPLPFQVPPQKKIFRKAKNFSGKCWRQGGRRYFFENKSSRNLSQNKRSFAIPACQGPLPASWAPYFTLGGGGVVLHPLPPQMARPCLRLIVDDHSYSGHGL